MVAELLRIPILVMRLNRLVHELRRAVSPRTTVAADMSGPNAGVVVGRLGLVEYALHGVGSFLQHACRGQPVEVLVAHLEDVLAGQHLFEKEVSILVIALTEFLEGEVGIGCSQEGGILWGQRAVVDGQVFVLDTDHFLKSFFFQFNLDNFDS